MTVTVKLQPGHEQSSSLKATMRRANAACNHISDVAWETKTFGQFRLQKATYYEAKDAFGLTAQMVVRCVSKVADAYKLDKKRKRTFRTLGSIAYDDRILRWQENRVSIWTVSGRAWIPFVCDDRTRALLVHRQGESDILLRDGKWFLYTTVNIDEPSPSEPTEFIGVDMGIVQIATDSDGNAYSGATVNALRARHAKLRAKLQAKGTQSAKRLLRKRRRKEARFAHDTNHVISKRIVRLAEGTGRGIAVENLSGIRDRVSARKPQRRTLHSWSFYDLWAKIEYKARLAGVLVVAVGPRNTSRQCACCGHVAKENRRSQSEFLCVVCGFASNADFNAALNLRMRGRAAVNLPYAGERTSVLSHLQAPAL